MQPDGIDDERVARTAVTQDRTCQHEDTAFQRVQIRIRTRCFLQATKQRSELQCNFVCCDATHPTTECLERVHGLFVARAVFSQLARARRARGRGRQRVERRVRVGLAVALHVADLLVEFEVVGLEAPDLGAQLRDHLELFAEFLRSVLSVGGKGGKPSVPLPLRVLRSVAGSGHAGW